MPLSDELIREFYATTAETDWRSARQQSLTALARRFGADAGAWLTGSACGGLFVETPRSGFSRAQLAQWSSATTQPWLVVPGSDSSVCVFRHRHTDSGLVSIVALRWAGSRAGEATELSALAALVPHLAEAGVLAMRLYIQRDEWLQSMGRANRGAAALVDADGHVHAGSARFRALVLAADSQRLPFGLPDTLGDAGCAFVHGTLHLRIERMDGLYVMHARQPLPLDVLSPREQQIARALGAGKTFKSVATQCNIAVSTVANHATRIYRKLGIFRREELMGIVNAGGR